MEEQKDNKRAEEEKPKEEVKPKAEVKPIHSEPKDKAVILKVHEYQKLLDEAAKVKELQDRTLRMQADFDNARKRLEKQMQEHTKYANEVILLELLSILDDLERTVQVAEEKKTDLGTFLKGVEMILAHLYEMLKTHQVKPLEVIGKHFDPHTSEALMLVESELADGTVVEEMQKGYCMQERVLRTAKVKVAKKQEISSQ